MSIHQTSDVLVQDPIRMAHDAANDASHDSVGDAQADGAQPQSAGGPGQSEPPPPTWIPIRSLSPRHRPRILEHLLALPPQDRYLRFGFQANDSQVARYVDGLDFDRDEIFGVYNRQLKVVAMAHLAYPPATPQGPGEGAAEFGGSVLSRQRGRGLGRRLFEHAMLHARNRGLHNIYIHALSENLPMLRIARRAGATVQRDGSESDAYLKLPPDTVASKLEQAFSSGAAEIDFQIKQQAHLVHSVVEAISDLRAGMTRSDPVESNDNSPPAGTAKPYTHLGRDG